MTYLKATTCPITPTTLFIASMILAAVPPSALSRAPARSGSNMRSSADPTNAEPGHGAVAERRRRMHIDSRLFHADAVLHESAAGGPEPDDPRSRLSTKRR